MWAPSLEELFAEAAISLIAVMGTAEGESVVEDVAIEANDLDALFVDWLSEVLFLFEAREIVPRSVRVDIDRERWSLVAKIDGVRATAFHQEGPGVKAVTYHGLEISDKEAKVYLDV